MRVVVAGTGYVGLVSGACLADVGHQVVCLDVDAKKIEKLDAGTMPIYEPGLEELVKRNVEASRLSFTTSYVDAIPGADVVVIAVGTPSAADGSADMSYVFQSAEDIAKNLTGYAVIVDKSTVPVGTSDKVEATMKAKTGQPFDVVSNPETLREGHSIDDFMHPARIIIGSSSQKATEKMKELYAAIKSPVLVMDVKSAEMAKYASNAFLATKISFINEMSHLCEEVGADVEAVALGMGSDPRIGKDFLRAGLGWGGGCFPKDVRALVNLGESHSAPMGIVKAAMDANTRTRSRVVDRLVAVTGDLTGKRVAVLGLAFKNNTDDTRESAALDIIRELQCRGANVMAFDPVAKVSDDQLGFPLAHAADPYEAATGADAVVIATEWDEFRTLDLARLKATMKNPVVMDARNLLNPDDARSLGFTYLRVGKQE